MRFLVRRRRRQERGRSRYPSPLVYFRRWNPRDPLSWFVSINEGNFPNFALGCRHLVVPEFCYLALWWPWSLAAWRFTWLRWLANQ